MNFKKVKSGIFRDTYLLLDVKDHHISPLLEEIHESMEFHAKFVKTYQVGSRKYHAVKCIVRKKEVARFEASAYMLADELEKLGYRDYKTFCMGMMELVNR